MLKREFTPGQWHAPLSLLTIDSDGVILGSRFDWARWMVPKWSAEYGEITFAEAVDIGPWKAVRIYKTNSRFGMLFACHWRRWTCQTSLRSCVVRACK